jgi:hypothetical protein
MGSVGECYDNAVIASFWARMQVELLDRQRWRTRVELATAIFEYLEIFHNRQRRHSTLDMLTPSSTKDDTTPPQHEIQQPDFTEPGADLGVRQSGATPNVPGCFISGRTHPHHLTSRSTPEPTQPSAAAPRQPKRPKTAFTFQQLTLHPQVGDLAFEVAQPGAFAPSQVGGLAPRSARSCATHRPYDDSYTSSSRASCAIGRPVSSTNAAASRLNSSVNF